MLVLSIIALSKNQYNHLRWTDRKSKVKKVALRQNFTYLHFKTEVKV